jgi:serine/threonine protein phosphatase 1
MKGRVLVIGDIHGALKALHQVLERAKVSERDTLIFLGDYVDGWSDSPRVIHFLMELEKTHPCIFLRGNHDELCLQWLKSGIVREQWLFNGGDTTMDTYKNSLEVVKEHHILFLSSLKNYLIDEKNRLFVHAGFTNQHGVAYEYFPELFYWDRTLWETALCMDTSLSKEAPIYPKRFLHYKEIYIGHTPVIRIGKTIPVCAANVWNMDTGAAYKGPLTILDVATKQFWQSDPVNELYPKEKGRN